jgi:CelD/BcsL family acetyltransferase involved in cellulose biosynthesis
MKIREIDNFDDFLALEESWNNVLDKCDHSVFSTWYWLSKWWKHFGNDKRLVLLLAEENNEIRGIAPLMYSVHRIFGFRIGKIEFIGTPSSDYNNFILRKKSEECIKLFINYLYKLPEKWEIVELTEIPENTESLQFLGRTTKRLEPINVCPYINLPKSRELFLSQLSRNQRKYLRKNLKRLEETFTVEFRDCSEVESYTEAMEWLIELHQRRMKSKGLTGVFADPRVRNFSFDIAESFSQKGWLGLFLLKLSSKSVASLLGFKYGSKFYAYITGFDPEYSAYGVGNLIFFYAIARCIQEGLTEFDFLRGEEEYKYRWKAVTRTNFKATIYKRGFVSDFKKWLIQQIYKTSWHFRRALKRV